MADSIAIEAVSEFVLSEADIERRRAFVNLQPADLDGIATIRGLVIENVDRLTATFFEYLSGIVEARPLLENQEEYARARVLKREHLIAIVGGSYDRAYAHQSVELGLHYSKAPLDPRVFLGAFHHLLKGVGELVLATSKDPFTGFEAFMSLKKVAFLDIGIIVDVLVFERERTIREQQAAIRELSSAKAREAAELGERNRRTEEASRLKSEFLANMSHELRTPLNAILGFAGLIHDGEVGPIAPRQKEFLGDILTSGNHLLHLINDVLDLSKVEAGMLEFHPEPIDFAQVVAEVLSVLKTTIAGKQVRIEVAIQAGIGDIRLDRPRLTQVFYNYLSNALKFTPEGGSVTIRVASEDLAHIRLEVADTGIGIKPEDIQRLFMEFQQLDAGAAKKHQGTGLGLALTRSLVEAQDGTVGVRSIVGEGSTFHAILPRQFAGGRPRLDRRVGPSPGATAKAVLCGVPDDELLVAVIDDDPGSSKLMATTLEQLGYRPRCFENGLSALTALDSVRPAAVILDLLMPGMDGFAFLQQFRARPEHAQTPILIWTVMDLAAGERARLLDQVHALIPKGHGGGVSLLKTLGDCLKARRPVVARRSGDA